TAIPQLIEMLEIAGSVITIDAMGCQKDITSLIIKKKGDYVLALKGNQKLLYQAVKEWFEVAKKSDYLGRDYSPA
ncbi:ISAs1 family transposase, partial [Microcoleus sp. herbarium5]|uniref:ISAs1 family transposase n=1 Tax=Microcoleus sp. herbarium5 TaxID=3055434 RepID=UPI002FD43F21